VQRFHPPLLYQIAWTTAVPLLGAVADHDVVDGLTEQRFFNSLTQWNETSWTASLKAPLKAWGSNKRGTYNQHYLSSTQACITTVCARHGRQGFIHKAPFVCGLWRSISQGIAFSSD
jgi:hypothetical protein